MSLKLEVGKTYLDRVGNEHLIRRVDGDGIFWEHTRSNSKTWHADGRRYKEATCTDDLVEVYHEVASNLPDLIRAALDGKTLQMMVAGKWCDLDMSLGGIPACRYLITQLGVQARVKPTPTVLYMNVGKAKPGSVHIGEAYYERKKAAASGYSPRHWADRKILCIEIDPDTLEVLSAKTEDA